MAIRAKRSFIYVLLFTLLAISMLDRINISVAGSSIAKEVNLSPTALGNLFSSFLGSTSSACCLPARSPTGWAHAERWLARWRFGPSRRRRAASRRRSFPYC
jgi:hypothetical protein